MTRRTDPEIQKITRELTFLIGDGSASEAKQIDLNVQGCEKLSKEFLTAVKNLNAIPEERRQGTFDAVIGRALSMQSLMGIFIGEVLYHIHQNKYWKDWMYSDKEGEFLFDSFEDYCYIQHGIKRTRAYALVDLYRRFVREAGLTVEKLAEIPWTKAAVLKDFVTKDNSDHILYLLENHSRPFLERAKDMAVNEGCSITEAVNELEARQDTIDVTYESSEIDGVADDDDESPQRLASEPLSATEDVDNELLEGEPSEDGPNFPPPEYPEGSKPVEFRFLCNPEQAEVIQEALNVAYRHTDVAAVNYLIEVICAEYLASVEVFPDEAKKKSVVDSLQLALSRASAELSDAR